MKILIIPDYGSSYGSLLVDSLRSLGHQVDTVAPHGFRTLFHAVLRYGKPDIIHLQWQHRLFIGPNYGVAFVKTIWFFLQWFFLRLAGIRFVWTIHNIVNHERVQMRWELTVCRFLARRMDAMIVLCDAVRPRVAQAYRINPDRLSVVPHGTYDTFACVSEQTLDRESARLQLALSAKTLFLFFGYIREYKGVEQLIEAFTATDELSIGLAVVGKPATAETAKKIQRMTTNDKRVILDFGFAPDDVLARYIMACDVVVLPYRDSLASGAVYLAAAFGRPIIAPKQGCLQEYPFDAGILYPPTDAQGLSRSLQQALTSDLDSMGAVARAHSAKFPWSMVADKTLAVYDQALDNHV